MCLTCLRYGMFDTDWDPATARGGRVSPALATKC